MPQVINFIALVACFLMGTVVGMTLSEPLAGTGALFVVTALSSIAGLAGGAWAMYRRYVTRDA